jgi:acyl carrier protein
MDDSIQDRVFAFVVEHTGVRRETLMPNTRLGSDIGLDGDDALEFFQAFRKEFAVDITDLQLFWDRYFAPEGMTLSTGLLFAIPGLVFGVLFTHLFPHLPDWFCFALAYAFCLASLCYLGKWRHKKRFPQVSIQDLIDTAKSGRWTKELPDKVAPNAATSGRDAGIFQR